MIEISTVDERIIMITEDWADTKTCAKISKIMSRLMLTERNLIDWEILVQDALFYDEEMKKECETYGDYYIQRNRHAVTTIIDNNGVNVPMTWKEVLDLELREREGPKIIVKLLFIR